jgi:hypothetical protein
MAHPTALPIDENVRAMLAGEMTVAAAARQAKVLEQSVGNWKRAVRRDRPRWACRRIWQAVVAGAAAGGGGH